MKTIIYFLIYFLCSVLFSSCLQTKDEESSKTDVNFKVEKSGISTRYSINGDEIFLRIGPGEEFEKIINKKATEQLGETYYAQINSSNKIVVEETKGSWSKVKVVEPELLSNTHIGWIKSENIVFKENYTQYDLDSNIYEILVTKHYRLVTNFHVLMKSKNDDQNSVSIFIKAFRQKYCSGDCNIMIYDTKAIKNLIGIYPLEGSDYIKFADHFVAMSMFSLPNSYTWYPYQNIEYKEFGGTNWKKKSINN